MDTSDRRENQAGNTAQNDVLPIAFSCVFNFHPPRGQPHTEEEHFGADFRALTLPPPWAYRPTRSRRLPQLTPFRGFGRQRTKHVEAL